MTDIVMDPAVTQTPILLYIRLVTYINPISETGYKKKMTPEQIIQMIQQYAATLAELIAALTVVTAITPSRNDNQILDAVLRVCNILAGNVGKNKNADADKEKKIPDSASFEEHA
jgi:hypothetical protein